MSGTKAEAFERGRILEILRENRGQYQSIAFMQLLRTAHLLDQPLSPEDLRAHLEYLCEKRYLDVTRRNELTGYKVSVLRSHEQPDGIVAVRLTAQGVELLDGAISDPNVEIVV